MTDRHDENPTDLGIDTSPERREHRHETDAEQTRRFVIDAARLLSDSHCEEVIVFDVRGLSDVTDYIIIGSGTSDRQMKSVCDDVAELGETVGLSAYGREEDARTTWIVLDLVDVICHLFEPATRAHYDLEMMWGDAPKVEWGRDRGSDEAT